MAEERIQKIMARAGLGSRRACEELIADGRVRVNGRVVILGAKADPLRDRIEVDGRPLPKLEKPVYIALHKPRGVLSTDDPTDPRPNVLGLIAIPEHVFPVGRLDYDSEGLMLLTNDGELANRLTHPRYEHDKEYRVLVIRKPDAEQLAIWRRGVVLEDGHRTAPAEVDRVGETGNRTWLRVVMHEGRKRQIREVGERIGLPVERILRVRIGTLKLGDLKPREWRYLTAEEVKALKGKAELRAPRSPKGASGRPTKPVTRRPKPPAGQFQALGERPEPAAGRSSRFKPSVGRAQPPGGGAKTPNERAQPPDGGSTLSAGRPKAPGGRAKPAAGRSSRSKPPVGRAQPPGGGSRPPAGRPRRPKPRTPRKGG